MNYILCFYKHHPKGSIGCHQRCSVHSSKESTCNAGATEAVGWILGQEDPLEEGMATHSGILAWRIPWTEEPGGLQSMRSQGVRNN